MITEIIFENLLITLLAVGEGKSTHKILALTLQGTGSKSQLCLLATE